MCCWWWWWWWLCVWRVRAPPCILRSLPIVAMWFVPPPLPPPLSLCVKAVCIIRHAQPVSVSPSVCLPVCECVYELILRCFLVWCSASSLELCEENNGKPLEWYPPLLLTLTLTILWWWNIWSRERSSNGSPGIIVWPLSKSGPSCLQRFLHVR